MKFIEINYQLGVTCKMQQLGWIFHKIEGWELNSKGSAMLSDTKVHGIILFQKLSSFDESIINNFYIY